MAFNGTWKADRNENYDKFMEQMGECVCVYTRLRGLTALVGVVCV